MLPEVEPRRERLVGLLDDLPARLSGHRAVDGEAVVVGVEREPLEVDGHTVDLVATPAEAVGPGRQQRQAR